MGQARNGRWSTLQVQLDDMCLMLYALDFAAHSKAPARMRSRRHLHGILARFRARLLDHMAADLRRRVSDDADTTAFLPHHYVCTFLHRHTLWPGSTDVLALLAEAAGGELQTSAQLWPTRHIVVLIVTCAEEQLPAHGLFEAAARVLCSRIETHLALRAHGAQCQTKATGLSVPLLTLQQAEGLLWAYAVVRRQYPFSAKHVARTLAAFLQAELAHGQVACTAQRAGVVADMLWSFAAMSHVPKAPFKAAQDFLDALPTQQVSQMPASTVETLVWAYQRSRVSPPRCCQHDSARDQAAEAQAVSSASCMQL